jgi:repressor LexA
LIFYLKLVIIISNKLESFFWEVAKITKNLSAKQLNILNFIKDQIEENGYPPSIREIGKAVGLSSSSTVHAHLNSLEKNGALERDPIKPRAMRVTGGGRRGGFEKISSLKNKVKMIPLVGKVAAGQPILAEQDIEGYYSFPAEFVRGESEDLFMLEVKGLSMIDAGILSGDFVIVKKQSTANNGDIVVALLENEATVKRFYKEAKYVKLVPENKDMQPIVSRDVSVLGKVIGLYRQL